jgi:hypothetical protein
MRPAGIEVHHSDAGAKESERDELLDRFAPSQAARLARF